MHPSEYLTDDEVTELRAAQAEMSTPPVDDRLVTFILNYDGAPFGPMVCTGIDGLLYMLKHECVVPLAQGEPVVVTITRDDMTRAEIDALPVQ